MVSALALPFVFVTLLWFFSTGAILWLNRLPRETHPGAIVAATPLAGAAVCALIVSANDTGPAAAYLAFTSALVIWGWHEASFLMGFVNGPSQAPLAPGLRGWARFKASAATIIHHEIALAVTLVALFALSWGAPNQAGALTFALLFAMRLSAKLNIFLGVRNLSADMMPDHLGYLKTHFRQRRFNPLLPFSIGASIALAFFLAERAGTSTAAALLLALTLLGILEHAFMMMKWRDSALWTWANPNLRTKA